MRGRYKALDVLQAALNHPPREEHFSLHVGKSEKSLGYKAKMLTFKGAYIRAHV